MLERSWVRIPAPYTGWTFGHLFVVKIVCLKRPKINEKEAGVGPFFKLMRWLRYTRFILMSRFARNSFKNNPVGIAHR